MLLVDFTHADQISPDSIGVPGVVLSPGVANTLSPMEAPERKIVNSAVELAGIEGKSNVAVFL
jgi:hypothetical protein